MNVAEAIIYAMCGAMAMICIYLYTKMKND
jgi:hypothetical protein